MSYAFAPERYEAELSSIIDALLALDEIDARQLQRVLRRYPKDNEGLFSKSEIIRGFRHLAEQREWDVDEESFLARLRMKPVRTASGVAPVTILTKPFPCPGECIFCPSDVRMPKSYLSDEPGAQRAAQHRFDPYHQTLSRLLAYHNNGHKLDKIELIILGGTWSHYPESYQVWFVKRCFDALNDVASILGGAHPELAADRVDFASIGQVIDGRAIDKRYNAVVGDFLRDNPEGQPESATWQQLFDAQSANETAVARCVGLVIETRPDNLTFEETVRIRRLGATKVQIGFQSLSDAILAANRRGHDVATTARAVRLLRDAGFKLHAHWMPNLYGSSPEEDVRDFVRMFEDAAYRPDELKIYPCSLIESAELMAYYEDGRWTPYEHQQLLDVLTECLRLAPRYCRVTRVIRDIPGTDIVAGNRLTNFRELTESELDRRGVERVEIRSREIRLADIEADDLELRQTSYQTSTGTELFLEFTTPGDRLAAFLRLSLPSEPVAIDEIATSAMIREVHVYGAVVGLGERNAGRSQHVGLGARLIDRAAELAAQAGFATLAVISSVGTREYYRRLGFEDGDMYQRTDLQVQKGVVTRRRHAE